MHPLLSMHCRNFDSTRRLRSASRMAPAIFGARVTGFAWGTATRATSRTQSTQPCPVYRREHD